MSDDEMTLAAAREWLRDRADQGATCPCCTQRVQIYKRRMTSSTARTMIAMYLHHGREFVHVPTMLARRMPEIATQGGYTTLAHWWGLLEEETTLRDDGGRAGWWRLTDRGEAFVRGALRVPSHALIYNSRCLGFEGAELGIREAIGKKFNYAELMAGL